jgi:cytochrome c oxidase assembly factor CtaG
MNERDLLSSETEDSKQNEVHRRILPLGLTSREAEAWYRYNVLFPLLTRGAVTIGTGIILLLVTFTTIGQYLESDLGLHMVIQHFLYAVAGFLVAYGIDYVVMATSRMYYCISQACLIFLRWNSTFNKRGIVAFVAAVLLTVYWYLPSNFDAAVLNKQIHFTMHITLLIVGAFIFVGAKTLNARVRNIAPIIVGKAMGFLGMFLLVTPSNVYSTYPVAEQSLAGLVLVVLMLVMDFTIVPVWLYNYFGSKAKCTFD